MPPKKAAKPVEPVEEKTEETGADLFEQETESADSLAEIAGTTGGMFEGDLLTMDAIMGKKVYILDFTLRPSTFREGSYICLQLKRKNGTMNVCNSTAKVPMKIANVDKTKLPSVTAFVKRENKTPGQKPYWDMASKEELAKLPWL
jgi:hypothetical protein